MAFPPCILRALSHLCELKEDKRRQQALGTAPDRTSSRGPTSPSVRSGQGEPLDSSKQSQQNCKLATRHCASPPLPVHRVTSRAKHHRRSQWQRPWRHEPHRWLNIATQFSPFKTPSLFPSLSQSRCASQGEMPKPLRHKSLMRVRHNTTGRRLLRIPHDVDPVSVVPRHY